MQFTGHVMRLPFTKPNRKKYWLRWEPTLERGNQMIPEIQAQNTGAQFSRSSGMENSRGYLDSKSMVMSILFSV